MHLRSVAASDEVASTFADSLSSTWTDLISTRFFLLATSVVCFSIFFLCSVSAFFQPPRSSSSCPLTSSHFAVAFFLSLPSLTSALVEIRFIVHLSRSPCRVPSLVWNCLRDLLYFATFLNSCSCAVFNSSCADVKAFLAAVRADSASALAAVCSPFFSSHCPFSCPS